MKRVTASMRTLVASPEANEQTEYVRMLSINAPLTPDTVRQEAKCHSADAGSQQGESAEQARSGLAHAEVAHQLCEHEGIEHGVEGVERPTHRRCQQCAALPRRSLADELNGSDRHAAAILRYSSVRL